MKRHFIVTATLLAVTLLPCEAKVRPSAMIGDNMVLQQNSHARIFGEADPGSTVTVTPSWDNKPYTTVTDRTGRWCLAIDTPAGGFTPYSITISDGEPLTFDNILVGEVWLASGQSNMQMPLKGFPGCCTLGGFDEIASARDKAGKIRFFTVPLTQSYTPLDTVAASWTVPAPETAPEYSALAWHFAKRMSDVLDVPVGIVSAAYGGAKVESWTPRELLETYPDVSLDPKDIEMLVHYHRPMLMYNAMFLPIKDYTYKGIIWYQGCSNVATYRTYPERLAAMVKDWRDNIAIGDIPFYAVEIAPYEYGDPSEQGKAPLLREAQWKAIRLIPNSGMISTNDLVEPYERLNIHPANKKAVGDRLWDLVLSVDLGKKHDGLYANLYIYNPKSGELEFQSAGMISGGKASWVFDHASDYAIVIDKESHEPVTFPDVPDTAYYAEAVNWAVAKKITEGIGNKLFGSNDPCTRAQIVTFLWRAAGSPGPKTMSGFSDVPADSYYAKAVAWAVENGITGGTGDGKFSPDATCTRAQAVTFLYRASGMPAVSGNAAFSDVATNAYYAAAVKWAEKNGITGGIGGGLFGSDNNCTRAQIVTFLYRNYQSK